MSKDGGAGKGGCAPGIRQAPVQGVHCRAGWGEWAALWRTCWTGQGQGRQVPHPTHLYLLPQLCAGPSLFQRFGCAQTGSCPQMADIPLRGADKSQVKTNPTGWAVAMSSSKVRFLPQYPQRGRYCLCSILGKGTALNYLILNKILFREDSGLKKP